MSRKELTYTLFVGGKQVERLTWEQSEKMAERLSESLSTYYSQHPLEYAGIQQERADLRSVRKDEKRK